MLGNWEKYRVSTGPKKQIILLWQNQIIKPVCCYIMWKKSCDIYIVFTCLDKLFSKLLILLKLCSEIKVLWDLNPAYWNSGIK